MEDEGYINVRRKNAMISAIISERSGSGISLTLMSGRMKETFCLYR